MKAIMAILLIGLALQGCASTKYGRANLAERAKTEMIGVSKMELFMCAGVPARNQQLGGKEFLTYNAGSTSMSTDTNGGATLHTRYCEVTFVLVDDVVEKISYTGKTGGLITKGEQCAYVFQNCLD